MVEAIFRFLLICAVAVIYTLVLLVLAAVVLSKVDKRQRRKGREKNEESIHADEGESLQGAAIKRKTTTR